MYEYAARVLKTTDGDTATLMLDVGFNIHVEVDVRLKGINAPELHSTNKDEKLAGAAAERYLAALLAHDPLIVKTERSSKNVVADKQEKFGRYLGTIVNGAGTNVNTEMVRAGHAIAYDGVGARPAWPWPKS